MPIADATLAIAQLCRENDITDLKVVTHYGSNPIEITEVWLDRATGVLHVAVNGQIPKVLL